MTARATASLGSSLIPMTMAQAPRMNHYVVCLDESEHGHGQRALEWALNAKCVTGQNDRLHIITVLPPASFSAYPLAGGLAGGAAMAGMAHEHEAAHKAARSSADKLLHDAVDAAAAALQVRARQLPGEGRRAHALCRGGVRSHMAANAA